MGSHQTILEKQVWTPMHAVGHQALQYLDIQNIQKYFEATEIDTNPLPQLPIV